jgi:uncharacterized circularly permuted ATP-grasp superfamily protein
LVAKSRSAARNRDPVGERVAAWTQGYVPLDGTPDEFIGGDGAVRPHWRHLLNALAGLDQEAIEQRLESANQRIRAMGMSYRHGH